MPRAPISLLLLGLAGSPAFAGTFLAAAEPPVPHEAHRHAALRAAGPAGAAPAADPTEAEVPDTPARPAAAAHPHHTRLHPALLHPAQFHPALLRVSAPHRVAALAAAPSAHAAPPEAAVPEASVPVTISPAVMTRVAATPLAPIDASTPVANPPASAAPAASAGTASLSPVPLSPARPQPLPPVPSRPPIPAAPAPGAPGTAAAPLPPLATPPLASAPLASPVVQSRPPAPRPDSGVSSLVVESGMGRVVQLSGSAASVFVADPKVAEVRPASANTLFIFGVAPGRTTVAGLDAAGAPIAQFDVTVQPSSYTAGAARAAVAHIMPDSDIRVESNAGTLTVSGQVATPADAARVMDLVRSFSPPDRTPVNNLTVTASLQVNLKVRIAEMDRNVTRDLGVNWSTLNTLGKYASIGLINTNPLVSAATTGSSASLTGIYKKGKTDINAVIDALAQDSLVHMLAEPNLTAISGQTASFLVGGEFPIPVAQQNNTVTVEFKQFGVSLAFIPTVMADGHISLKVRPEVSALSSQGAVQLSASNSSISIPALTVRRAETTVELGSGQSFAIAGLLQDNATLTGNGIPGLGDVPVLGALFHSDNFQRDETELVIIVTPYVVRPVTDPATLRTPTEGWRPPNDIERILLLRQTARGGGEPRAAVPGTAGFVVQ